MILFTESVGQTSKLSHSCSQSVQSASQPSGPCLLSYISGATDAESSAARWNAPSTQRVPEARQHTRRDDCIHAFMQTPCVHACVCAHTRYVSRTISQEAHSSWLNSRELKRDRSSQTDRVPEKRREEKRVRSSLSCLSQLWCALKCFSCYATLKMKRLMFSLLVCQLLD